MSLTPLHAHVSVGTLALLAFWLALAVQKGGLWHRRAGRVFFVGMLAVVGSVAPLLLAVRPFDPARVVQLVYLSVCVGVVVGIGWLSVRSRRAPDRFAALPWRAIGSTLAGLGGLVLIAGIATGDPVAAVLSWVGLAFGSALVRFSREVPPARWWLQWHLDAVCGLFTAVHGTLSFVGWRTFVAPDAAPGIAAFAHLGVLGLAVMARVWLSRRYRAPSFVFAWPRVAGDVTPAPGR